MTQWTSPKPNNLSLIHISASLLVGTLGSTPLMMAYWFAPLLAGWGRVSAVKAMFFSFVACWRNWRAFFAYGLSLIHI